MPTLQYDVLAPATGKSHLSGLDHFELSEPRSCDRRIVLDDPRFAVHALDAATATVVFTRSAPIDQLLAAPFFYLAQQQTASEVVTMPSADFHDLAAELPDPECLGLLYSTGRCGSTLVGQALAATTGAAVLSEPDAYTTLVAIRDPDGSDDARLIRLARSITRFLGHACGPAASAGMVIKFRGWCTHIADLMQRAQPAASSLFLTRDLDGWIRSQARLMRIGDPERERTFRRPNPKKFGFDRDRFVRLPTPVEPESRVQEVALTWVSLMHAYLDLQRAGVVASAIDYQTLITEPEAAIAAISDIFGLLQTEPEKLDDILARDSQAGTRLSGRDLARDRIGELTADDVAAGRRMAARSGVDPSVIGDLPGMVDLGRRQSRSSGAPEGTGT